MDQKEIKKLEALFHALIDIPGRTEREATAVRLSGDDAALARRALELVDSDEKAKAANDAAQCAASEPRTYGNYRTVRPLASGGMGAVYLAERADGHFQQTVALKVIAPHVAGAAFRERFLAERQILAGLNHPNITKLLDGGVTGEGTPYLVMEYVDGQPLDRYCDMHSTSLRERLELFLKVCAPVAYAHRNLVVHRDLKPSNILVTGEGQPMLLDFGTAKLLAGAETNEDTGLPLSTPRYSSPEQRSRAPITTSSDIFSLGVILYELLTGAWPFGDPASPQEMLQRFARNTPMTLPQTVVTREASLARAANLRSLQGSLAGDLGNILAKALAPAPDQRYESVQALAADIGNWLAGLPVRAKAPSMAYRAGKFLRRRWLPIAAAAVFVLGLLGSTLFAVREARVARAEARKSQEVTRFLNDMLASASTYSFDPDKFTVAQMLDSARERLEKSWKGDPLAEATLRQSLGESYSAIQHIDQARAQLTKALDAFHSLGKEKEEAGTLVSLGEMARNAGRSEESVRFLRQALEHLKHLGRDAPPYLVFSAKSVLGYELGLELNRDLGEARNLIAESIALAAREPSIPKAYVVGALTTQGNMLLDEGKFAEAEPILRRALDTGRREDAGGLWEGQPLYQLMSLSARTGNFAAARDYGHQRYEIFLHRLGPNHPGTVVAAMRWARYRADTGETAEAIEQVLQGMPVVRKSYPPPSFNLWTPTVIAAYVLNQGKRFAEAEGYARESLAVAHEAHLPEADPRTAESLFELGKALQGEKKYREATTTIESSAAMYDRLGPAYARRAERVRKTIAAGPAQPR
ncbi:MAG: serine/threonine-protein kinase [Acidobacteriia bacterium]|nr:serine/threonine-protein kinase [Terriglobia bacterium]